MQIKEFEAYTMKECLQHVRQDLGPEAVILETRKFRKGGLLGFGARDAVRIVAATGITVHHDLDSTTAAVRSRGDLGRYGDEATDRNSRQDDSTGRRAGEHGERNDNVAIVKPTPSQSAAVAVARNAYARAEAATSSRILPQKKEPGLKVPESVSRLDRVLDQEGKTSGNETGEATSYSARPGAGSEANMEQAMAEIRDSLVSLQREQRENQVRTVSAVVSAVTPRTSLIPAGRFPELYARLTDSGVSSELATELIESLPDLSAWKPEAQLAMAQSALGELISRRVASSGPIHLIPGHLKAVALIGPTGVGKTTTIAKLAAHFALIERKKVALLTVDTYRIAAVEQLKTYGQIIGIPIGVAYSQAEILPAVEQYADYDLLLIDTAGRSQKHIMQVAELKSLLESVACETHLVLSAPVKEQDMLEATKRFSAARVDRLIFSKLDETSSYGTLLNVADKAGIPLSYMTTGQKVPEDIELASGSGLANLLLR